MRLRVGRPSHAAAVPSLARVDRYATCRPCHEGVRAACRRDRVDRYASRPSPARELRCCRGTKAARDRALRVSLWTGVLRKVAASRLVRGSVFRAEASASLGSLKLARRWRHARGSYWRGNRKKNERWRDVDCVYECNCDAALRDGEGIVEPVRK